MTVKEGLWRCYSLFKRRLPTGPLAVLGMADTQVAFCLKGMSDEDALRIAQEILDIVEPLRAAVLGIPGNGSLERGGMAPLAERTASAA